MRTAGPADYARWGAELGFATAREAEAVPAERRDGTFRKVRAIVDQQVAEFIAGGTSAAEASLYRRSFEGALLSGSIGVRQIKVKTDDGVIEIRG